MDAEPLRLVLRLLGWICIGIGGWLVADHPIPDCWRRWRRE